MRDALPGSRDPKGSMACNRPLQCHVMDGATLRVKPGAWCMLGARSVYGLCMLRARSLPKMAEEHWRLSPPAEAGVGAPRPRFPSTTPSLVPTSNTRELLRLEACHNCLPSTGSRGVGFHKTPAQSGWLCPRGGWEGLIHIEC